MPYLYGITETPFLPAKKGKKPKLCPSTRFRIHPILENNSTYDKNAWPIQFVVSPPSLVELCVVAVDKLPLSPVYQWTDLDVQRWIHQYGYRQYMNTFRVNMVTGRKLLLVDATALSAMNIKDFEHIKDIAYGIRMLFHFELAKCSRSISLPDAYPNELYLLWHTHTGFNYNAVRRSDLYRRMRLICERSLNLDHWDMLKLWLSAEQSRIYKTVISQSRRRIGCQDIAPQAPEIEDSTGVDDERMCLTCIPPCDCNRDLDFVVNGRLKVLGSIDSSNSRHENFCETCLPPCECSWLPRFYLTETVLSCLQKHFPEKFSPTFYPRFIGIVGSSVLERWTRFSI